jgi:hypothetical protein
MPILVLGEMTKTEIGGAVIERSRWRQSIKRKRGLCQTIRASIRAYYWRK